MNFLRNLDLFPKIQDDMVTGQKKSLSGACIFLITISVMLTLTISECDSFFYGVNRITPYIQDTNEQRVRVNLNISLY